MATSGWPPLSSFDGSMTAAAITGHLAFRGPSDRCTARTGHSAELSRRTTKVRGVTEVKGSSHRLQTGGADPLPPLA